MGRPTLYDPKYADDLIQYFDVEPYRERKKTVVQFGEKFEIPFDDANDFPTLAGFAIQIGVHRDTLHEWASVHPEFSDAYKRAKDYQERFLAINGLKGLIAPAFGIFTAKNVLGWRDRQPDEHDVVVNNNLVGKTDAEIDDRLEKLMKKHGKV